MPEENEPWEDPNAGSWSPRSPSSDSEESYGHGLSTPDSEDEHASLLPTPANLHRMHAQDPRRMVDAFRRHDDQLAATVAKFADVVQHLDPHAFIQRLIDAIKDKEFRDKLYKATVGYIGEHPYQVAFISIGIILMCNPLAMLGFGALGPVAGSVAAAWQASYGGAVAAGSLFAILQGVGMTAAVTIPLAGAGITAAAIVSTHVPQAADEAAKWVGAQAEVVRDAVASWFRRVS